MNNNKLIAEFMGYEVKHNKCYSPKYNDGSIAPMQFHQSWDWLRPVILEIEMVCQGVPSQLLNCNLYSEIGEVYQAVVEFIKAYNDEEEKDTRPLD